VSSITCFHRFPVQAPVEATAQRAARQSAETQLEVAETQVSVARTEVYVMGPTLVAVVFYALYLRRRNSKAEHASHNHRPVPTDESETDQEIEMTTALPMPMGQ